MSEVKTIAFALATKNGAQLDFQKPQVLHLLAGHSSSPPDAHESRFKFRVLADIVAKEDDVTVSLSEDERDFILKRTVMDTLGESARNEVIKQIENFVEQRSLEGVGSVSEFILNNLENFYEGKDTPTLTEFIECFCKNKLFVFGYSDEDPQNYSKANWKNNLKLDYNHNCAQH